MAGPRAVEGVDAAVRGLCQLVLVVTGIALMVALGANVVARYIFDTGGFDWAQEVPERLFPWFIMAGVALAVQTGGHVAVETALFLLPRRAARLLLLAGHALVVVTYVVLARSSLEVAEIAAIERSPVLGLSGAHGYWAVAAGCALLVVGTVTNMVRVALLGPEGLPREGGETAVT
ncbi:TRAP transporter small permease subunit [Roseomonas sp. PWR1]|uniref:TRAP transporter small permease protein n=1 Tax=Roseomonas nitratireducens TaxID=2820810 RepID=A0ABS4AUN7_9PROT|nr:TRAP transporter small permease subunit [Neoroseomonas nitratireducens]MBP0465076.1 TRAP transporter small permease subunit [Neoroseomonas nitratireducens]